ncbi:hypothetical protein JTE90_024525 [Oedothorax gibbosus]|uniref:Uncharacterized protein n=1 Tax=Oedothorax gibbosus TaxID=931172 RepID=A0AAV6ULF7_9ARAC|nr:hypothetical protein JTE90_024525 [Oedothorax gibbosus]
MHLVQILVYFWAIQKVFDQRIPDDWQIRSISRRYSDLHYFTYSGTCPIRNSLFPMLNVDSWLLPECFLKVKWHFIDGCFVKVEKIEKKDA